MVSKSVKQNLVNGIFESHIQMSAEFLKAKRKKTLTLEEAILILCMNEWKSPTDISQYLKQDYDYVRNKMKSMNETGDLLIRHEVLDNNTTKNFYLTDMVRYLKKHNITRFPVHTQKNEIVVRNLVFRTLKATLDMADIKL